MIVGEAPGGEEVRLKTPFVGGAGNLLDMLLKEVGLDRGLCFVTNVCRITPPEGDIDNLFASTIKGRVGHKLINGRWASPYIEHGVNLLWEEIDECKPIVVVAMGSLALWALTGKWGIRDWRGSTLQGVSPKGHKFKVVAAYHPGSVLREWSLKPLLVHDLRKVEHHLQFGPILPPKNFDFQIEPTFREAKDRLWWLLRELKKGPLELSTDIETRGGHIACVGFAWNSVNAISIPFMEKTRHSYWTREEEIFIWLMVRAVLKHKNFRGIGQNFNYDRQYFYRWMFVVPITAVDTMITHHAMFSYSPKGLGHLSSLYCEEHQYWKDDGRLWDPTKDERQYWYYNGEDCARTYEIAQGEKEAIAELAQTGWPKLPEVVKFQHRVNDVVFKMMCRGVRSDDKTRAKMGEALMKRSSEIQAEIDEMIGYALNIRSSPQMKAYLYDVLGLTPIKKRNPDGKWVPTANDDALQRILEREPLLRPLIRRIQALRSAGVFMSTFVLMRRDWDGRLRCSYNVAGTITYRFSSSQNAFGSGGNLQNVPTGDEDEAMLIPLPNVRKLFLPDYEHTIADIDGDSADLRIVTGESGCRQMQAYFNAGAKPYVEIAKEFYRDPTITKKSPHYKTMKALCHGTNYGGEGAGLASRIGLITHEVERIQKWYFGMCPEIKEWQDDIRDQVRNRGYIENPFGYRCYFPDRVTRKTENEALAWTPQSSVGILINKVMVNIDDLVPEAELLLQVHDSATLQYLTRLGGPVQRKILEASKIEIPCKHWNITVPMAMKTSTVSWGDCE